MNLQTMLDISRGMMAKRKWKALFVVIELPNVDAFNEFVNASRDEVMRELGTNRLYAPMFGYGEASLWRTVSLHYEAYKWLKADRQRRLTW